MYKDMDIAERATNLKRLSFQLNVLNSIIKGPYVSGNDMGLADAALFPTLTFCNYMLPEVFGWKQAFTGSKLQAYWEFMQADADASQVQMPHITTHKEAIASWQHTRCLGKRNLVQAMRAPQLAGQEIFVHQGHPSCWGANVSHFVIVVGHQGD